MKSHAISWKLMRCLASGALVRPSSLASLSRRRITQLTADRSHASAPVNSSFKRNTNAKNNSTVTHARVSDCLSHVNQNRRCLQWFYDHPLIDVAAATPSVRLTPETILYTGSKTGDEEHVLKTAQYLHKELPVRVAHRVASFRRLPFMVGCNPLILAVHELYIRTFYLLHDFPSVSFPSSLGDYLTQLDRLVGVRSTKKRNGTSQS